MFSGIVESTAAVRSVQPCGSVIRLTVARPVAFDDLKLGDSVATNGVCLTVASLNSAEVGFDIGAETIKVTSWSLNPGDVLNLERSLRLSDRLHGHFVSGHVDEMGQVVQTQDLPDGKGLRIQFSSEFAPLVWKKGSITVNGVSLTVNEVQGCELEVWLIPETLRRTNLSPLKAGDLVTLEADSLARFWVRQKELGHA